MYLWYILKPATRGEHLDQVTSRHVHVAPCVLASSRFPLLCCCSRLQYAFLRASQMVSVTRNSSCQVRVGALEARHGLNAAVI